MPRLTLRPQVPVSRVPHLPGASVLQQGETGGDECDRFHRGGVDWVSCPGMQTHGTLRLQWDFCLKLREKSGYLSSLALSSFTLSFSIF